jgi:hypothetical protein
MKKSRSKFLKIVDEKHDINFHWPYIELYTRSYYRKESAASPPRDGTSAIC